MIVEGCREILRAKEAGVALEELYVCKDFFSGSAAKELLKEFQKKGVAVFETSMEVFEKISFGERREGLLAVCRQPKKTLKDFTKGSFSLWVVVESVEKPGNLGAILRTCDAAGVDGVLVCDPKTDIYNPNVIRASLGAVFSVFVALASKDEAYKFFRDRRMKICATLPAADIIYTKADLKSPVALVLGSEQKGLSPFWAEHADLKVRIPMHGKVDSLNVSTCASIIIYETLRQQDQ